MLARFSGHTLGEMLGLAYGVDPAELVTLEQVVNADPSLTDRWKAHLMQQYAGLRSASELDRMTTEPSPPQDDDGSDQAD
jgi:hypothetical protein